MAANQPILVGNRYELVAKLGVGGYGAVYEAMDHYLGVKVAIKLLQRIPAPGPWQEAQMMETLSGDYILPVKNADQDMGQPYVVTELALNGTIENRIGYGLAVPQAIRWTKQTAAGVQRCHDHGLIHRDLKPGNIFLDADNRALVGDFGLAWSLARGGATLAGSPDFTAPDAAAGRPMDTHSDVYGLGACLFTMLAGRPPIIFPPAVTDWATAMAHVAVTPPDPIRDLAPHVPVGLHRVVEKAMDPDPANRFRRAIDMDTALGALDRSRRTWTRSAAHPGHTACWNGSGDGLAELNVCVIPNGTRFDIETLTVATSRRKSPQCHVGVNRNQLPPRLRSTFRALRN